MKLIFAVLLSIAPLLVSLAQPLGVKPEIDQDPLRLPEEKHLKNIRQLTFGGENAEAYFSADGKKLIFQSTRDGRECDQIYEMNIDGSRILYASTHLADANCPPKADYSKGYVWALYPSYEIFSARPDGSDLRKLTKSDGYDAEATISPNGKQIVFTSLRNGDLDVYTMDLDGNNVKRLTTELGYDGGPFYSYDNQWIVYRAYHPKSESDVATYKPLLK